MADEKSGRSRLKSRLLALLQGGAGSLVLAATALVAPSAVTAATPSTDSLFKRAEGARAQLVETLSEAELTSENPIQLAFWGNSRRSRWPNWPNWRNF